MHVTDSIRILLMLLSHVMQKTGRLTFEEKCKMLEFIGTVAKHTEFRPSLSNYDESVQLYTNPILHLEENKVHNS